MSRELATLPLVCAIWDDAHGKSIGEFTKEEIENDFHQPAKIMTFGLLVTDNDAGISLAQEMTAEVGTDAFTHFRGLAFIPRAMLVELIHIGIPKRPAKRRKANGTEPGI